MSRRVARRIPLLEREEFEPLPDLALEELLEQRARRLGFRRETVAAPAAPPDTVGRWDIPEQLPGTGMLSAYPELKGTVTLIRLVRSQPWLYEPLRDATILQGRRGKRRMQGCWALLFLAFVDSGIADVQPFYGECTEELWRACGFTQVPSYKIVQKRFVELETHCADAFRDALVRIIRRVAERDPRVGAWVAIDATMVASNARPHRLDNTQGPLPVRIGSLPLEASTRIPTESAEEIRRGRAALPEGVDGAIGGYVDLTAAHVQARVDGRYRIFTTSSGRTLICLDPDAGYRLYQRSGRATAHWFGYYCVQPTDHYTGLALPATGFPADENEESHAAEVFDITRDAVGRYPWMATADKAYSLTHVYTSAVERGITLVAPYKPRGNEPDGRAQATTEFDEHGVPFCRHCRVAGTDQVGFVLEAPKTPGARPRAVLRVKCAQPSTPACRNVQEISCFVDPRRLLPVWRTHPAYAEARLMHQNYERSHKEARSRSNAVPRHFETRSKRVSLQLVILRANVAALNDWVRSSVINGWLGNPALNPERGATNAAIRRARRRRCVNYMHFRTIERRLRLGRWFSSSRP